ncbi:MAG TPA: hypothetical protein DIW44_06750 [Anaerolineaceae bacterium]|nr:hypothetical protein [Anaerolineaceae bacterium]
MVGSTPLASLALKKTRVMRGAKFASTNPPLPLAFKKRGSWGANRPRVQKPTAPKAKGKKSKIF